MYDSISFSCMHQDCRDCIVVRCSFLFLIFIARMASDASSSSPAVLESAVVAVGPPATTSPAAAGDHPTSGENPVAATLTSPSHLEDPKACTRCCESSKVWKSFRQEEWKHLLDDREEWKKLIEAYERDQPSKKTMRRK